MRSRSSSGRRRTAWPARCWRGRRGHEARAASPAVRVQASVDTRPKLTRSIRKSLCRSFSVHVAGHFRLFCRSLVLDLYLSVGWRGCVISSVMIMLF